MFSVVGVRKREKHRPFLVWYFLQFRLSSEKNPDGIDPPGFLFPDAAQTAAVARILHGVNRSSGFEHRPNW